MDEKKNKKIFKSLGELAETFETTMYKQQEEWEAKPEEEKARILEERRLQEEAEKREALIRSYQSKGIPPRFYDASWKNWIQDTEEKQKSFATVKQAWKTNLFLCGKSGTGKTHLAMCLAKDGAIYRRLPDIFREVRSSFDNLKTEQEFLNHYGSVKLLVIDEIGRQKYSPFEQNLFFEIIDKRWNNILPTTLVTNLNEKEFSQEYGTAIVDRLRPVIVRFNWDSRRESLNLPPREENQDDIDF
jgi:DNA replication protein DnaC